VSWVWYYWTPVLSVLGLSWLLVVLWRKRRPDWAEGLILVFFAKGVVAGLLLRGHAATHEFFHFNVVPWCAVAAAVAVEQMISRVSNRTRRALWRITPVALIAATGLWHFDQILKKRFYANWHDVCIGLKSRTNFNEAIAVNFSYNAGDFLGGYPQYYIDRRLIYGVPNRDEAGRLRHTLSVPVALYAQFYRQPQTGRIVTEISDLRLGEGRKVPPIARGG